MSERIVIIGGGIAGLSAAFYAYNNPGKSDTNIILLESANYWGGKILTDRVDGFVIEAGPDTFIVTKPWGVNLCKQLGIVDRLKGTNPHQKNTYILHNDQLHPLPGGLTMMIPTDVGAMARTGLLSWRAKVRMGLDYVKPALPENGDESLGDFVTRRLGRQAYERLVEPLMSGIYAGDGDQLSLQATFPYLRDLELKYGGLIKGALSISRKRAQNGGQPAAGSRSIFLTPTTGLSEIVEALVSELENAGVDLKLNASVKRIKPFGTSYQLDLENGETIPADKLILATPPYVSAQLIAGFAPLLATELDQIEFVTTATVSLAFRETDLPRLLDGYGYVIPRREGRKALACTWTSTKFPHRAPEGYALLRVFIGRAGQEADIPWDNDSLLEIAQEELSLTLGIKADPVLSRVFTWEKAMPQYNVGHPARLQRIENLLDNYDGLALAGNGYQGIGIPDCIHSGELAVARLMKQQQKPDKIRTTNDVRN
jgi:oxygen-dependent protoporphyrinogen oxidase